MNTDLEYDVVVIGAGFAGMTAARDLTSRGLRVAVIEGRDRIGGRTWLDDRPIGIALEMGGAYVHWLQQHVWAEMVNYGLEPHPMPVLEEMRWIVNGTCRVADFETYQAELGDSFERLVAGNEDAFPDPPHPFPLTELALKSDQVSVADAIDALGVSDAAKAAVRAVCDVSVNGDASLAALTQVQRLAALSCGSFARFLAVAGEFTIEGGTRALIDGIASDSTADMLLNTTVTSIDYSAESATVATSSGPVTGRRVIITVPINALSSITFDPALPSEVAQLAEEKQTSTGFKIWVLARGTFTPAMGLAPHDHPLDLMSTYKEIDGNTLFVGFGAHSGAIDPFDHEAVREAMSVWFPDIEVLDTDCHDWTHDPFSQGTWAGLKVGQLSRSAEAATRPMGAIQLAGADYALGWISHIDGAIESGRRAARRVLNELKP